MASNLDPILGKLVMDPLCTVALVTLDAAWGVAAIMGTAVAWHQSSGCLPHHSTVN